MANDSGTEVALGSSFYSGGSPKWSSKFKLSNGLNYGVNGSNNEVTNVNDPGIIITTIENLLCSNITISLGAKTFSATKNSKSVNFEFEKFVNIETFSNLLVVHTVDRTPISLVFTTEQQASSAENRIYTAINTNADPTCTP